MPRLPQFPPVHVVQVIRFSINRDPSGVLIARSADIPSRAAFASDMPSLDEEIRDTVRGYFAKQGEWVRLCQPRGNNDLTTWEVEMIDGDAGMLMAAE